MAPRTPSDRFAHLSLLIVALVRLIAADLLPPHILDGSVGSSTNDDQCADQKNVWIVIEDSTEPKQSDWLEDFKSCIPSAMCVKMLKPESAPIGSLSSPKRVEQLVVALRDYLLDNPDLNLIMLGNSNGMHPNPFTNEQLARKFKGIIAAAAENEKRLSTPGIVFGTEQSCWDGTHCNRTQVEAYLKAMNPFYPQVRSFPSGMWIGYRASVLSMLHKMLGMDSHGRGFPATRMAESAYLDYVTNNPSMVALDIWEEMFGSAARGFFQQSNQSNQGKAGMCTFNGKEAHLCELSHVWSGCCVGDDGFVELSTLGGEHARPLVWSVQADRWNATFGTECAQAFAPVCQAGGAVPRDVRCTQESEVLSQRTAGVGPFAGLGAFIVLGMVGFVAVRTRTYHNLVEDEEEDETRDNSME